MQIHRSSNIFYGRNVQYLVANRSQRNKSQSDGKSKVMF